MTTAARLGRLRAAVAALKADGPDPLGAEDDAPTPEAREARRFALLRSRVHGMAVYNFTSLSANLLGAVIVEALFLGAAPRALQLGWGLPFLALWLARVQGAVGFARRRPTDAAGYLHWLRRWRLGILLSASLWGAAAWLFYPHGDALQRTALLMIAYTYCVACVPILAPQLGVFAAYTLIVFVPMTARLLLTEGHAAVPLAALLLVFWLSVMTIGRNYRRAIDNILGLKRRAEALSEQLRAEKAVAERARQEAEVANRAKTQFFAAASHDLRQPLHALGLFAEALRRRQQGEDRQTAELVNSINASVDALEELFSELLDITRIDSGGVDVKPRDFALADVLRRIRLHFEPVAFDKGLELRLRGGGRHARADPLLVERILRNLVSNALRYTEDGGVLVSVRRRGERLRVQVWDTGVGIGAAEQAKVFEEFYQVARGTAPTADQKKGLGLGLSIVKRLAGLMQAPLALASEPGRGSVFTFELPAAEAPAPAAAPVPSKAAAALTLDGRRIVVVEDEAAVRQGLEVLLASWGAEVTSFDTAAAATAWAARQAPAPPPDLLIVDYRLENGATGVEAIDALRARFGRGVPAIVVTGSTMTAHDAEAEKHDFHLMMKPVAPNRLRAMIGFKLGVK